MTAEPESGIKKATTFEVRATRVHDAGTGTGPDGEQKISVQRVTEKHEVPEAAAALAAFAAAHPEIVAREARQEWNLRLRYPGPGRAARTTVHELGGEPPRGSVRRVAVQPRRPGQQPARSAHLGTGVLHPRALDRALPGLRPRAPGAPRPVGGFFTCPRCGWKTGLTTRKVKAADASARITGWCGGLLIVRYSDLGLPCSGCTACEPGYKHPTVNDLRYGNR